MKPILKDNDAGRITVSFDGRVLMSWDYSPDRVDRAEKMRHAWYFCDGFLAAQEEPRTHAMHGVEPGGGAPG